MGGCFRRILSVGAIRTTFSRIRHTVRKKRDVCMNCCAVWCSTMANLHGSTSVSGGFTGAFSSGGIFCIRLGFRGELNFLWVERTDAFRAPLLCGCTHAIFQGLRPLPVQSEEASSARALDSTWDQGELR